MACLPPIDERTMRATYERVLARRPGDLAQTDASGSCTFAESYSRALRLTAGFAAAGVGRQEPAAMLLDNSLDLVHAFTGLALGGMVEVPVNTAYKGRFLTHILNDSQAAVAAAEDGYLDRLAAIATARAYLGFLTAPGGAAVQGDEPAGPDVAAAGDEPAHADQRVLRHLVPENRVRAYDVRPVATGSWSPSTTRRARRSAPPPRSRSMTSSIRRRPVMF